MGETNKNWSIDNAAAGRRDKKLRIGGGNASYVITVCTSSLYYVGSSASSKCSDGAEYIRRVSCCPAEQAIAFEYVFVAAAAATAVPSTLRTTNANTHPTRRYFISVFCRFPDRLLAPTMSTNPHERLFELELVAAQPLVYYRANSFFFFYAYSDVSCTDLPFWVTKK